MGDESRLFLSKITIVVALIGAGIQMLPTFLYRDLRNEEEASNKSYTSEQFVHSTVLVISACIVLGFESVLDVTFGSSMGTSSLLYINPRYVMLMSLLVPNVIAYVVAVYCAPSTGKWTFVFKLAVLCMVLSCRTTNRPCVHERITDAEFFTLRIFRSSIPSEMQTAGIDSDSCNLWHCRLLVR